MEGGERREKRGRMRDNDRIRESVMYFLPAAVYNCTRG